jgi:hypothetical protein
MFGCSNKRRAGDGPAFSAGVEGRLKALTAGVAGGGLRACGAASAVPLRVLGALASAFQHGWFAAAPPAVYTVARDLAALGRVGLRPYTRWARPSAVRLARLNIILALPYLPADEETAFPDSAYRYRPDFSRYALFTITFLLFYEP